MQVFLFYSNLHFVVIDFKHNVFFAVLYCLIHFFKAEFVLCIAAACAVISMFFVPPSAAYLDYIDVRTLCLLFCSTTSYVFAEEFPTVKYVTIWKITKTKAVRGNVKIIETPKVKTKDITLTAKASTTKVK